MNTQGSPFPETIDAGKPLSERIAAAPAYPLRGAALAALIVLTFVHAITDLLPGSLNWAGGAIVWASIILYAMECLRRTADGYADPPEVTMYSNYGPAVSMMLLQILGYAALVLAVVFQPMLWFVVFALTFFIPVIASALAFEDNLLSAINPGRWAKAIGVFGPAYLLPVGIGVLEDLSYVGYRVHGGWLGSSLWFLAVVYLCLLQFHVLGVLIHRHHERLGHTPDADVLAADSGRDDDDELLGDVARMVAQNDREGAEALLRDRLRARHPSVRLFDAYRELLRHRGDREGLLANAQTHLSLLLNEDQLRPALRLVVECQHLDPKFMPGQPESAARLADAAEAQGMMQLALKLARGYPNTWPRDARAPHYGLMAARLLADRLDRTAEAGVLGSKLLRAYAGHPAHAEIEAFMQAHGFQLDGSGATA